MRRKKNGMRWLAAGTVLGMAGAYMGISQMKRSGLSVRKVRAHMARLMSRAGRSAGEFISDVGDSLAKVMR
ncbi:MAG: hypothetical protein IIZ45_05055 [Firmicutes bacterium]|nr:hypothetical protein [Bacillota bacterium]